MSEFYKNRATCRLCDSKRVEIVVPMEPIPLATPNVGDSMALAEAKRQGFTVPMDLYLCHDCGHVQILQVISPEVQYLSFRYTTSISLGLPEHFVRMADEISAPAGLKNGDLVVEVGSNDGTLLRPFQLKGMRVLGIDHAQAIANNATKNGVPTLARFFTAALGREIEAEYGKARLVIANNTMANLDDLSDMIAGITAVMAEDGLFVFETSYGADVVRNTLLDTVYHEHLSYFMVRPLQTFFAANGMELVDVQRIWTKVGSIRGFVRFAGKATPRTTVADLIVEELKDGLDKRAPYDRFTAAVRNIRTQLAAIVAAEHAAGRRVAGYGASVGTITLLHQLGLTQSLDFIADDTPLGAAVEGPGYRILIVSPQRLIVDKPGVVVVLAWRYADPIVAKNEAYRAQGGRFVIPLPTLSER